MPLTETEKAARARQRMIHNFRQYQIGTCTGKVAAVFQRMKRAEAGAVDGHVEFVRDGQYFVSYTRLGECTCVTCGRVCPWNARDIHTGHYLAGRRASIVLEETNAHPQCAHCNKDLGGNQGCYEQYMLHVYGQAEIDRLRELKAQTRTFTRPELADLKIAFTARLKAAERAMEA